MLPAVLLAACGGGAGTAAESLPPPVVQEPPRENLKALFTPSAPIPTDAHARGMWSELVDWPLIPVHAVLLPDGRLLSFGSDSAGQQTANFIYDVWDPTAGLSAGHLTLPNSTGSDLFCSAQILLPGGATVFVAGGDVWDGAATRNQGNNNSNLFAVANNALQRGQNMNRARWYSSAITLPSGETYVQGGIGGADRPEVRSATGEFRLLDGANTEALHFQYPRNFVAPDGQVFGFDSTGNMYRVDPSGSGSLTRLGQFASENAGSDASAAMFRPGHILQFGGNSNGALVIDIRRGTPTVTPTQSMSTHRRLGTSTILADGKVLATGGSRSWNEPDQPSYHAEVWDPQRGQWAVGAQQTRMRLYHSMAVLMPDATVLVGGGGAPGPQNNKNAELYFPPYLFTSAGTLAPRPALTSAPTVLNIGKTFTLQAGSAKPVARVALVKTAAVSHGFNAEQRFIELPFSADAGRLTVQAPANPADAPPGFYMLFLLDSDGVPSVAKVLRMNQATEPRPASAPILNKLADRSMLTGSTASLQLLASAAPGSSLRYAATGLPPGLRLDAVSGLISGSAIVDGTFHVAVSASDATDGDMQTFIWIVSAPGSPLQISLPAPVAARTGAAVSFQASTSNGVDTQYKWDFGDGSAETPFSTAASASHVYNRAGVFRVSVTAIDARQVQTRVSMQQTVYLPASADAPSVSSNLLWQTGANGSPRLWVVNPDSNTVTVLDATSMAKLAELPTGSAPRSITQASNGLVWVSNLESGTLSIYDPLTLTLSRTLALPRGAQPYGVVASRLGFALVVLQASGQVLKFDTQTFTQTGGLDVGPNPRHVSIAGDGATAYISRFISAPMLDEHTAAPGAGAAEVLQVNAVAMSLTRSIALAHSERPDAESQGRGLPNYLGAVALSPDGSQAFVPSKQDNVKRGALRDGLALNFQNTVRAISSRIDLASGAEDPAARIDHDNAGLASAAAFDPRGVWLFVALETSREVAVIDAHGRREVMRLNVGRAPQGLAISGDGSTLFVSNVMERSVSGFDLRTLRDTGQFHVPHWDTVSTVATELLSAEVLKGKQLFYDARDTRLARDRYLSCAACHNEGGHDGRVWDLSHAGEGLRNTISLRGRGVGHGRMHWSGNFDEGQDFEGQVRSLAQGNGLMSDVHFYAGTRSAPLGDAKAGLSADLDALAAYLTSLTRFAPSPARSVEASFSIQAAAGREVFAARCLSCHAGQAFTDSSTNALHNIGTLKPTSGQRLGAALTGIDTPTLRDAWATAPYLHDGSAATLEAAVLAHRNITLTAADLGAVVTYVRQLGGDEISAPLTAARSMTPQRRQ